MTGADLLLDEVTEVAPEPEPEPEPVPSPDPNPFAALAGMVGNIAGGASPLAAMLDNVDGLDLGTVAAIADVLGSVAGGTKDGENPLAAMMGRLEGLDLRTVGTLAGVLGNIAGGSKWAIEEQGTQYAVSKGRE